MGIRCVKVATASRKTIVLVSGMRDNACRERIADALARVRGVRDVEVSLMRGRAVVCHDGQCKTDELVLAVKRSGYSASLGDDGFSS
jgi:copper chaperone CopZ